MEKSEFYLLGGKMLSSTVQVSPVNLNLQSTQEEVKDEHFLIQGKDNVLLPVLFRQKYGKKLLDMLDTGWPGLYLISDNMRRILEENNLSGWKTFPVIVKNKKGEVIEGYHGLSIIGRSGPIEFYNSKIIEKRMVPEGPLTKYYVGMQIDPVYWDGSDFFLPGNNFIIIITEKAASILKNNELTNVSLKNLSEVETEEYTVKLISRKG